MRSLNADRFDDTSVFNDLSDVSRRGSYRGMRRRREDERMVCPKFIAWFSKIVKFLFSRFIQFHFTQRQNPESEVKTPPPKFDLATTNFPPLPGGVPSCLPGVTMQTESVLENRMADVVKGISRDKVVRTTSCTCVLSITIVLLVHREPSISLN